MKGINLLMVVQVEGERLKSSGTICYGGEKGEGAAVSVVPQCLFPIG